MICKLLNHFESNVECSEDPFEPKPIEVAVDSKPPNDVPSPSIDVTPLGAASVRLLHKQQEFSEPFSSTSAEESLDASLSFSSLNFSETDVQGLEECFDCFNAVWNATHQRVASR